MAKFILPVLSLVLLSGCASGYHPNSATPSVQAQMRMSNPDHLNCPAGAVAACDIEGGGLVGKTYSNCRCIR